MYTDHDFFAHTINDAAERVGGYERLSALLQVALEDLMSWGAGHGRPPASVLFRIVDLTRPSA